MNQLDTAGAVDAVLVGGPIDARLVVGYRVIESREKIDEHLV